MNRINCVRFNQDCSCFAVAHSNGFKVYNSDPLDQWVSREFGSDAGIAIASVLDRTNYVLLVGNGTMFPRKRLMLWNDRTQDVSNVDVTAPIVNAFVSREVLVGVTEDSVHIASLEPPHTIRQIVQTHKNEQGVSAMHNGTLVVPARTRGQVSVIDCGPRAHVTEVIACHKSEIAAIAVNDRYIATASVTGTLIRIHDRSNGTERWFRRGLDRARVYSLAFSPDSSKIAVLSDKQTLHIFDLNSAAANEKHPLSGVPFAPTRYFCDEWSFARTRTRSKHPGICGWTSNDTIIVIRSKQAQWEKYVLQENELLPEGWRAIR